MTPAVLILDFETTGLSPKEALPIEIGFILYQNKKIKSLHSFMIDQPTIEELPKEIEKLLDITTDEYKASAIYSEDIILSYLLALESSFEYFIAHNSLGFDELFFKEMITRHNADNKYQLLYDKPWLDSMIDIDYQESIQSRKLQYIASEFGYANPYQHRALFDCIALAKILDQYNIEEIIERAKSPMYDVQVQVKPPWDDSGVSTDYAKSKGFKWNPAKKIWSRKIRESECSQENFDYPIIILGKVERHAAK